MVIFLIWLQFEPHQSNGHGGRVSPSRLKRGEEHHHQKNGPRLVWFDWVSFPCSLGSNAIFHFFFRFTVFSASSCFGLVVSMVKKAKPTLGPRGASIPLSFGLVVPKISRTTLSPVEEEVRVSLAFDRACVKSNQDNWMPKPRWPNASGSFMESKGTGFSEQRVVWWCRGNVAVCAVHDLWARPFGLALTASRDAWRPRRWCCLFSVCDAGAIVSAFDRRGWAVAVVVEHEFSPVVRPLR